MATYFWPKWELHSCIGECGESESSSHENKYVNIVDFFATFARSLVLWNAIHYYSVIEWRKQFRYIVLYEMNDGYSSRFDDASDVNEWMCYWLVQQRYLYYIDSIRNMHSILIPYLYKYIYRYSIV